ncbi:Aldo-keto reductase family 1 member A1-A, partial [Pseudolycoriella hygida]
MKMECIHRYLSITNGHKLPNGRQIPVLGIGSWDSCGQDAYNSMIMAIEHGVRLVDTASSYKNEAGIGKAIREKIAEGVLKREDMYVITKLWNTDHRPDLVQKAFKESLENLGVDYIDLYLMHNPYAFREGDELFPRDSNNEIIPSDVDFVDTWREMERLFASGLAKNIGISNFNELQIVRLLKLCDYPPSVIELECHPLLTNVDLSEFCKRNNILFIAYSPLGSPNRPIQFTGEPKLLDNNTVKIIGMKYNKSPAQILIRYQLQRGHIPIPKSETLEFIRENVDVFNFEISPEDMSRINSMNIHRRFVNSL